MDASKLRWRDNDDAIREGSLFAVFAALGRGEAASFPALRPHQREPWHAFCVQVAAMALLRANRRDLPGDEADWRELLLGLTPDWPGGEAWALVVEDWTKPALLQPPIMRPADRGDYKSHIETPDALDMLVTAKNHDVKQERMVAARAEHWLFALVTLQTSEGFLGAGNYGVSRMNGGFASRMSLGIRPLGGAAAAFRRDVRRLIEIAGEGQARRAGLPLVWLRPWDGTASLAFSELDELYVEVCRRVRLVAGQDGHVSAMTAGSKVARVAAAELKGKTGDPWAPIKGDLTASVTPTSAGFGYRQMTRLLDPKETHPAPLGLLAASDDPEGLAIVASALVRGQGKTEGLHRRAVPISRKVSGRLGARQVFLDRLALVANRRTKDAGEARTRLRRAMMMLVQGGPRQARLDDDAGGRKIEPWAARFDLEVDRGFFDDAFWDEVDEGPEPHTLLWRERLSGWARAVFANAMEAAPRTTTRRLRAKARPLNYLDAQLRGFVEDVRGT